MAARPVTAVRWSRLVLHGFGRFAGTVCLELGPGLNVLVAPNEAGKSTLLAGLAAVPLWVALHHRSGGVLAPARSAAIGPARPGLRGSWSLWPVGPGTASGGTSTPTGSASPA